MVHLVRLVLFLEVPKVREFLEDHSVLLVRYPAVLMGQDFPVDHLVQLVRYLVGLLVLEFLLFLVGLLDLLPVDLMVLMGQQRLVVQLVR